MARTSSRDRSRATFGEPFALPRKSKRDPHTYVVQGVDDDKSRFQIKRSAPTAAAALEAVQQAVEEARFGVAPRVVDDVTMSALFDRWWDHEETVADLASRGKTSSRALADSSRIKYRDVWHRHLNERLGTRRVSTIRHAEVYDLLHEKRSFQPKPLLDVLRVLFRYAENAGLVDTGQNPMRGSFQLPTSKPEPKPMPVEVLDVIEAHLATLKPGGRRRDAMRLHDSFVLMRATGVRISELLAVRVRDVDLAARAVSVRAHMTRTIDEEGARFEAVEGSKTIAGERTVIVSRRIADMLKSRMAGKTPQGFLFATSTGRAVVPESWRNELSREIERINEKRAEAGLSLLEGIHPHRLRVTVASQIVKGLVEKYGLAAGLESARKHLGHRTTATLVHYVTEEVQVEDHSAILDELDSVALRERTAQQIIDRLSAGDPFLVLEVVSSERTVGVIVVDPLDDDQRKRVQDALAEHEIRLLG